MKCIECKKILPENACYENGEPFKKCPKCWIKGVKVEMPNGSIVSTTDFVSLLKLEIQYKL